MVAPPIVGLGCSCFWSSARVNNYALRNFSNKVQKFILQLAQYRVDIKSDTHNINRSSLYCEILVLHVMKKTGDPWIRSAHAQYGGFGVSCELLLPSA